MEKGSNYNYFRDYDPSIGRYVESDPMGIREGLNTFAYVKDTPLRYVDPRGLAIKVCKRSAQGMPGNHRYIFDTRGVRKPCGMEQSFGFGDNPNKDEPGATTGDCPPDPVPGSDGLEDQILDCCERANKTGMWVPFFNDCYTVSNRRVKKFLSGAGDNGPGRFNTKCPSCWKPQPPPLDAPSGA